MMIKNGALLHSLLDHFPQPVFWKNRELQYINCTRKFAQEAGLEHEQDIIGLTDFDLPWKDKWANIYREEDLQILETGIPIIDKEVPFDDEMLHSTRWILVNKYPIYDEEGGAIVGILGFFIDITAKKEAMDQQAKRQQAENKVEYLRVAAGSIAHDLRTPLSSVKFGMGGAEKSFDLLIEGYKKAVEQNLIEPMRTHRLNTLAGVFKRCQKEVDFANNFIDLTLNNMKFEQINNSDYQYYDIVPVIKQALSDYPFEPEERDVVTTDLDENFLFWGNPIYLKNILNNLLKNALYFIKKARKGHIFIQAKKIDNHYQIVFKDTAMGAPEEVVKQLFNGFYSANTNKGTGLGLAFCYSAMESFNGEIRAESVEGEHMTFILDFPANEFAEGCRE